MCQQMTNPSKTPFRSRNRHNGAGWFRPGAGPLTNWRGIGQQAALPAAGWTMGSRPTLHLVGKGTFGEAQASIRFENGIRLGLWRRRLGASYGPAVWSTHVVPLYLQETIGSRSQISNRRLCCSGWLHSEVLAMSQPAAHDGCIS